MKYRIFSLIGGGGKMRTHGHREGSTKHWGSTGGNRGGTAVGGSWGGIDWGDMPNVGEGEEGSNTHCYVCSYANVLHVPHMDPKT